MENTTDQDGGVSGSEAQGADGSAAAGRAAAAGQLPFHGLSATTAAELSQLARAALQQSSTPLFGDPAAAAGGLAGNGGSNAGLGATDIAAMTAALAGFTGQPQGGAGAAGGGSSNPATATGMAAAESALNSLLMGTGINLGSLGNLGGFGGLMGDAGGLAGLGGLPPTGLGASSGGGGGAGGGTGGGSHRDQANEEEGAGDKGTQGNKQLSSRYRGVCWNKKNKRWQAAINSGGKYLYLGSFVNEDEAARQFDRAAIKIRGKKAKLNFHYADYVDADGNLLEDLVLPTGAGAGKEDGGGGGRGRKGRASAAGAGSGSESNYNCGGGLGGFEGVSGLLMGSDMMHQAAMTLAHGGGSWGARSGPDAALGGGGHGGGGGKGKAQAALLNMTDLKAILPQGCSLDYMLPGMDADMFGLVYKHDMTGQRGCGVWTGYRFQVFGIYQDEQDAKQTIEKAMVMLFDDRQLRAGGGGGGGNSVSAAAATAAAIAEAPLMTALGMGGLGGGKASGAAAAGGSGSGLGALFGLGSGDVGRGRVEGIGSLANYDIAKAARLAQEAAAQQGVSMQMSYPPLSTGLPEAAAAAAASVPAAAAAGSRLPVSQDSDLHYKLSQIMQQQDLQPVAVHPSVDGGLLSRLGDVDVEQLRLLTAGLQHDAGQQQQQQPGGVPAAAGAGDAAGSSAGGGSDAAAAGAAAGVVASIEDLVAAVAGSSKRKSVASSGAPAAAAAGPIGAPAGAVAANSSLNPPNWPELLGLTTSSPAATAAAAAGAGAGGVTDADMPAAKRQKAGDGGVAEGAAAANAAAAAAAAGGNAGATTVEAWGSQAVPAQASLQQLSKVGLQDALKALCAMTQNQ